MLCNNYDNLSHVEKIKYIGELLHSVQSDDHLFNLGLLIIYHAREKGLLDGVVILPESDEIQKTNIEI